MDRKRDRRKEHKTEGVGQISGFRIVVILLCACMAMAVAISLLYFRLQIRESTKLLAGDDGREYGAYYVLITDDRDTGFWQGVLKGAREEAEASNIYLEQIGERIDTDYDRVKKMEMAIYADVDGIILDAADNQVMNDLIDKATAAGIPVVTVRNDSQRSSRVSFVNISYANLSREYAKQIRRLVKDRQKKGETGKVKVCVLLDAVNTSGQNIVLTGIQDQLAAADLADQIEITTSQIRNSSVFSAEEEIRDLFLYAEDQIPGDIILCLNTTNTACVYQTVLDYNLAGQVDILGFYENDAIRNAIANDVIQATITVDTDQMGKYCVEALTEYRQSGYVSDYYAVDTSVLESKRGEAGNE
ncbi:MAG: substrate-binding domain-containing protein [Lachnospiraceae bacterium]|nr:substrate-binding domain-containing protein [Lachnospiraceae bacterium]